MGSFPGNRVNRTIDTTPKEIQGRSLALARRQVDMTQKILPVIRNNGSNGNYGRIDDRMGIFVKLGVGIGLNSETIVKSQAKIALEAGITGSEVYRGVLQALHITDFANVVSAMRWVDETVQKDEDGKRGGN